MSSVSDNNRVFDRAFSRLMHSEKEHVRHALENMLDEAVACALDFHDMKHQMHIQLGDNYGWMIVYNGKEVKRKVKAAAGNYGEADQMLDRILSRVKGKGWVGVVMAGLKPDNYYEIDYEIDIMEDVVSITPDLFNQFFKEKSL